jgi:hypothetical protein
MRWVIGGFFLVLADVDTAVPSADMAGPIGSRRSEPAARVITARRSGGSTLPG